MTDEELGIGVQVWAYNTEVAAAREDMRERGVVVESYRFLDETHWKVELIDTPCRQVLSHRAAWLAPRWE